MPWPATTSGSSNGCTKAIPVRAAISRACTTQSSTVAPPTVTVAPSARQPSTLPSGALGGITTSHATPAWRAARASAHAWLPALPATTPARASSPSAASLAVAPRTLKEPVRCRFSAFRTTSPPPVSSASVHELSTGVTRATSSTASRTRVTSSAVTVTPIAAAYARAGGRGIQPGTAARYAANSAPKRAASRGSSSSRACVARVTR